MPYNPITGEWERDVSEFAPYGFSQVAKSAPQPVGPPPVSPTPTDPDVLRTDQWIGDRSRAAGTGVAPPGMKRYGGAGGDVLNSLEAISGYEQRADEAMRPRREKREDAIRDLERQLEYALTNAVYASPGIPGVQEGSIYGQGNIDSLKSQIGDLRGIHEGEAARTAQSRSQNRAPLYGAQAGLTTEIERERKNQNERAISEMILGPDGKSSLPPGTQVSPEQAMKIREEQRKQRTAKRQDDSAASLAESRASMNALRQATLDTKGKIDPRKVDSGIATANKTIATLNEELAIATDPTRAAQLEQQIRQVEENRQELIGMQRQFAGASQVAPAEVKAPRQSAWNDIMGWFGYQPKQEEPQAGAQAPAPAAPQAGPAPQAQAPQKTPASNSVRRGVQLKQKVDSGAASAAESQAYNRLMQIYEDARAKGQDKATAAETAARAVFGR